MAITKLSGSTVRLLTSSQVITSLQSVVKELLENALDAGCRSIDVKIIDNGMTLIEVCDNGTGITDQDAQVMALPYHTSKIKSFEDLEQLNTYGFRGEAISAMCQVADVSVITKREDENSARKYSFGRHGNVEKTEMCAGCTGTVVQIKNLFKYLPVRKQIFNDNKKIAQDLKQVERMIKSFGVCQPSVRISLKVNGKHVFIKPVTKSLKDSLGQVLGTHVTSNLQVLEDETLELGNVQLIIPKRNAEDLSHIHQGAAQFVFVNKRPVNYKELEAVIVDKICEHFGSRFPQRKKPVYCLSINCTANNLDVNLEPNKTVVYLKNLEPTKQLLCDILTKYYGLNAVGCEEVANDSTCDITSGYEQENDKENEVQQQKRRKIRENSPDENLTLNYSSKSAHATDNLSLGIPAPLLSDSDSNESFPVTKQTKTQVGPSDFSSTITGENEDASVGVNVVSESITEDVEMMDAWADGANIGQCTFVKNETTRTETDAVSSVLAGKVTLEQWSRGQVPGLPCPTMVAVGAPSKSKSPAQKFGPKGFSLFSEEFKAKLLKKHPDLSPVMIAAKLSTSWKELSPEERAYYRGCESSSETPTNSSANKSTSSVKKSKDSLKEAKDNLKLKSVLQYVQQSKAKPQLKLNLEDKHNDNMPTNMGNVRKKFEKVESQDYPHSSSDLSVIGRTQDPNLWLFQEGHRISAVFIPMFLEKFNLGLMLNAKEVDADILEKFLKQGFLEADGATHCFYNL